MRDALRAAADTAYESMNPDQGRIFDTILERLEDPNGGLFFVDGRAERGKAFLMAAICDRIRGMDRLRRRHDGAQRDPL